MAVRALAGCVAELFGPAASPAPPANGYRCSETAGLCPRAPGRYSVDLVAPEHSGIRLAPAAGIVGPARSHGNEWILEQYPEINPHWSLIMGMLLPEAKAANSTSTQKNTTNAPAASL